MKERISKVMLINLVKRSDDQCLPVSRCYPPESILSDFCGINQSKPPKQRKTSKNHVKDLPLLFLFTASHQTEIHHWPYFHPLRLSLSSSLALSPTHTLPNLLIQLSLVLCRYSLLSTFMYLEGTLRHHLSTSFSPSPPKVASQHLA